MYYHDYLDLDRILGSQHPESFREGRRQAHDEMLFIITHQAYELWFKQIQFELDFVQGVFSQEHINDNSEDLNLVRHRLNRVIRILELLSQQVTLLDTMTPLDFLEFRNLLTPASGFQSLQFRVIEARLGLRMEERHRREYYKRTDDGGFTREQFERLEKAEAGESLRTQVDRWLQRMPFFDVRYWGAGRPAFWADYRALYSGSLTEREEGKLEDFDKFFLADEKTADFSPGGLRAALFIMLYRDYPVFQTSYQILDSLIEIDHWLGSWRHKHLTMVRRMIGMRVGTGNTTGAGYLEGALAKHYIFKDLAGLSTYLIERRNLPALPGELIRHLSFNV